MGWLKKWFGGRDEPAPSTGGGAEEHAVLLRFKLSDEEFGSAEEVNEMHALQDELERAIDAAMAGELDGDEFGGGFCVVYLYGPDAETLWEAVAQVLEKRPFRKGSHAIKRFGPPGEGREERVDLEWEG